MSETKGMIGVQDIGEGYLDINEGGSIADKRPSI